MLESAARPDFPFFQWAGALDVTPAPNSPARTAQLHRLASALLSRLQPSLPKEDFEVIKADAAAWDPSEGTFMALFPEVVDCALRARGIEPTDAIHSHGLVPSLSQNVLAAIADPPFPPSTSDDISTHLAYASGAVKDTEAHSARHKCQADLDEAGRREDYIYLCQLMGVPFDASLQGGRLHLATKTLAMEWTSGRQSPFRNKDGCHLLQSAVAAWHPDRDGFLFDYLRRQASAQAAEPSR